MFRRLLCCLGILVLAGLSGCIDDSTVISVDKTGAGTVVSTTYMSKAMQDMMAQMAATMGGEKSGAAPKKNPLFDNVEQFKTKAAAMGQGVKFVSADEVKKADGSVGVKVIYAFEDINKLRIKSEPDVPSGGAGASTDDAGKKSSKKKESPVTFEFVKGATPKLTVKMSKPEQSAAAGDTKEKTEPTEAPSPEQMAQMKQMFDGFHVYLAVKVDGDITKSNAAFVEKDSKTDKKQVVTLIDMDIGKLLKDEATFKKLAALGQIGDMTTARQKMKDIPGLKFETSEKVDIEFK